MNDSVILLKCERYILPALQAELNLMATDLGLLSSGYYFAYVAFMMLAGMIIDWAGLYRSWAGSILVVALGSLLFGASNDLMMLVIARVLMGVGSAFAMIGVFSVALNSHHSGLLIGITMGMCMLGALLGQGPWLHFTEFCGHWQQPYLFAGVFGVLLFGGWLLIGKYASYRQIPYASLLELKSTLTVLLRTPLFWVLAVFIGVLSTPQTVFMALWGPQFLASMYAISTKEAAYITSLISVGGAAGAVVLGYLGDIAGSM